MQSNFSPPPCTSNSMANNSTIIFQKIKEGSKEGVF